MRLGFFTGATVAAPVRLTPPPPRVYSVPPPDGASPFHCSRALDAETILRCMPPDTGIWISPDIGTERGVKDGEAVQARVQLYRGARTIRDFFRLHPGGASPNGELSTADFIQGILRHDILLVKAAAHPEAPPPRYPMELPRRRAAT